MECSLVSCSTGSEITRAECSAETEQVQRETLAQKSRSNNGRYYYYHHYHILAYNYKTKFLSYEKSSEIKNREIKAVAPLMINTFIHTKEKKGQMTAALP